MCWFMFLGIAKLFSLLMIPRYFDSKKLLHGEAFMCDQ